MSPSLSQNALWPAQTEPPIAPRTPSTRKRKSLYARQPRGSTSKVARQIVTDSAAIATAKQKCQNSGNEVISCFPTADTIIPQHQWATFVWNSRRPEITQTNLVDIFLFHGDSQAEILHWHGVTNPVDQAGSITAQVNDSWFGDRGTDFKGQNISYPYYWVLIRSDATLDGSQMPQATFSAVQTTMPDSVMSSMASTSSAAAAASAASASASSLSAASASQSSLRSSPSGASGLQPGKGSSSFPHWAIAVITVLGFLALVAFCILLFLLFRRILRREPRSNRGSMGSASPMMANVQGSHAPHTPLLEGAALVGRKESSSQGHHAPSVTSPDAASTISRANSADQGPFSGADAAIMADAFRKALRKPDFAEQPVEEGESPPDQKDEALINRELAEEGRDIRNVGSSRGVKVEAQGDSAQTTESPPH